MGINSNGVQLCQSAWKSEQLPSNAPETLDDDQCATISTSTGPIGKPGGVGATIYPIDNARAVVAVHVHYRFSLIHTRSVPTPQ